MRVLLVEDDEPVAQSLRRGLVRYGFTVEWVTTGRAALVAVDAVGGPARDASDDHAPYDVVLLDLGLPDAAKSAYRWWRIY